MQEYMENKISMPADTCPWCGQIRLEKVTENPVSQDIKVLTSWEPCSQCRSQWSDSVIFIEVSREPFQKNLPSIGTDDTGLLYPTLNLVGLDEEQAKKLDKTYHRGQRVLMHDELFQHLFGRAIEKMQNKAG